MSQTPTVFLAAPTNTVDGQIVTLSITVFNSANSPLNATVTLQITGPNNYLLFDVVQVKVNANSAATAYYDWAVPSKAGTYTVIAGFLPPSVGGADLEIVQVS